MALVFAWSGGGDFTPIGVYWFKMRMERKEIDAEGCRIRGTETCINFCDLCDGKEVRVMPIGYCFYCREDFEFEGDEDACPLCRNKLEYEKNT